MKKGSKKVIVAMSGGVDSSVAAALLKKEGHEVIGATMRLLPKGTAGFGCCGTPEDLSVAKRAAEKIGIPHYILDYAPDFEKNIIQYFVDSYVTGETPNPCIACNRFIKFDKLRRFAKKAGATRLATGHYARLLPQKRNGKTRVRLFESKDPKKDQSYVLYMGTEDTFRETLFPVGNESKSAIRELARRFGLQNADKKESQEICFVPNRDYGAFVNAHLKRKGSPMPSTTQPGPIADLEGRILGEHKGIAHYTIGQRKGLGLTVPEPYYVIRMDPQTNTLVVGPDSKSRARGLKAEKASWVAGSPPRARFSALVKIRYKHEPAPAAIRAGKHGFTATFKTPQRAVTPGQAAVVYRWDKKEKAREVLGGGTITASL